MKSINDMSVTELQNEAQSLKQKFMDAAASALDSNAVTRRFVAAALDCNALARRYEDIAVAIRARSTEGQA